MASRGSSRRDVVRSGSMLLAGCRDEWEESEAFAGPVIVASRGDCAVVCDATLYYKADLVGRLARAGVPAGSHASADLILAAYLAFGPGCVDVLEGDYAFCVWDGRVQRLFAARDPFGSRSLFHMPWEGGHLVASTVHPLVARRGAGARLRTEGVLRALLLRPGDGTVTAWEGIDEVPGGHVLALTDGRADLRRFWSAQAGAEWVGLDEAEAVEAASAILGDAVSERCLPDSTALAMSGGMDSTAVLALSGAAPDLLSFGFPEGDPGDERWYVEAVAERYGLPVHWVDIAGLGFFENATERALVRSNCHGHLFEGHNRMLAETARGLGDRVLLNGHGGDNVFGVGDWVMGDLMMAGRWRELRRYFRARGYRGMRQFVQYCLRPAVPSELIDALEPVLGRHICSRPWERPLPPWLTPDPTLLARITEEDRAAYRRSVERPNDSVATRRRAWSLMDSNFQRACAALFDLNRDEGVELRMPFYDRRLISLVMARPTAEFNKPGRYKVMLQRAVEDRLPPRDRATRGGMKSGTAVGIMESRWADATRGFLGRMEPERWLTEEMGLVDLARFRGSVDADGGTHWRSAVDVGMTLFSEAWVRAQVAAGRIRV